MVAVVQMLISTSDGCRTCMTFSIRQHALPTGVPGVAGVTGVTGVTGATGVIFSIAEMKLMIVLAVESMCAASSFFLSCRFLSVLAFF